MGRIESQTLIRLEITFNHKLIDSAPSWVTKAGTYTSLRTTSSRP